MAAKKKKTEEQKMITLAEFRAWLEGVEEMQGPDWSPTLEQWKRIRDKLNTVGPVVSQQPAQPNPAARPVQSVPTTPLEYPPPHTLPVSTSNLSAIPQSRPAPAPVLEGDKIKTPHIDTSKQDYRSGFE